MNLQNFRFETDADGVALAVWDCPGRSMNVITQAVIDEIEAIVDAVVADPAVKGCVITSGKDNFSGGADLTMLQGLGLEYEKLKREQGEELAMRHFFEASRRLSLVFRKLETCGKPFAAAVSGLCLGGAFELALSCHHRVVSDDPKTRVGLPEIKVGLFPGGGGTQRVARLMQTGDALQMLFKGEQIRPAMARSMGLVHEVAGKDEIVAKAKAWILAGGSAVAPWDVPKFKAPSGKVYSPAGMMIWPPANAIYRRETHDNYPAAKAILASVYEGLQLPMDLGLKVESRYFAMILRTKEAAAMIRTLFISMGELNKGARRPKDVPATSLRKVGVVGAGFMGAGVAYVTANAGLEVVLVDQSTEAAEKGKAYAHALITGQINKGRAKTADRDALLARIQASADYADLADCDLVIEAVFEDPKVKAEVIAKVEAVIGPDTIFASNTSTLPISGLAKASSRPEAFVGIHFFSPVEKMMLVEIIKGAATGDRALATALDYVRTVKKTPIVVNDARGFFANRCVGAYILEGHKMLNEGVPPAMIENAGKMAGMPVGPLSLNDEVALDLGLKIAKATEAQLGPDAVDPAQKALLVELVENQGRLGRKNRKGFYDYPEGAPKRLWPGLKDLQPTHLDPDTLDIAELKHRLLVVQALEAARTVGEGVITDPREADVGSILGFGFAPFTGGALSYIDFMGAKDFVALAEGLEAKHGPRFAVPDNLRAMAESGGTFYGEAAKQAA
ncbi:3-hydroxyacyl-CoA dehydrogenase [Methylobacterium sp. WL30]|uniref:3-hydroxyacyl-CoA dehydrogenase NAD-binding domain-containing protein n=1 Tax=unclassified Methylobacterium TaxID=2615210 RepID=UPI0011CA56E7|nr:MULTISPECIES: 3-hydroxyacyl-CoA dehydrogenase NAD-binding domain-containing protein [unclassified Methylobacterium]TXM91254.1 3-hydroxyacyl-CoA dehydrogenase [Methylobacterium sp. WL116]TXN38939.1 3-hydroxyacyl-CoA dehydrogenase [Methylobacterium sp. WL93]TXN48805.1 3-hydroxyacyl-CoA dehydrogenase [Methylobacterium sp. WL119]TXN65775.1 3-hydroxyacyl-CoA dehydrogenase [Methylobacterium sp. WL30]